MFIAVHEILYLQERVRADERAGITIRVVVGFRSNFHFQFHRANFSPEYAGPSRCSKLIETR